MTNERQVPPPEEPLYAYGTGTPTARLIANTSRQMREILIRVLDSPYS
jgi:hypothetical protein